jgi:general secretion pathway protein D
MTFQLSLLALLLTVSMVCPTHTAWAQTPSTSASEGNLPSKDGRTTFAKANPEDITNENFPNMIESFDYPNANLSDVIKAISKLTGKNFILDGNISQGKISIIAPSKITVAEAYKAFLTALAMNNLTIVPSGNFLKIRRMDDAAKENIETYAGAYFPNADQLVTRIIRLKYISAEEMEKTLKLVVKSPTGLTLYAPTNSLIITDLGSNIERIQAIINQLDVPGFEEKLAVLQIKFARAKDIAELIDQIINKGEKKSNSSGIPRFRPNARDSGGSGSGAANYSLVLPDNRTNAIIVVGNDAGIERIRGLVAKLDFRLRAEDSGGVYVYRVRYGEAEKIEKVLNGIASESTKKQQANTGGGAQQAAIPTAASQPVFGGDVKITADKDNNALVVTASKQDYEVILTILKRLDFPRDQVFVKSIIMELNANDATQWGINYYKFGPGGKGRVGFATSNLTSLVSPLNDNGLVLGFGKGDSVELDLGAAGKQTVTSLLGMINFIKKNSQTNILSTPQISALDNEEASIEVGDDVPVGTTTTANASGQTSGQERKELTLKLKLTPFISPDTDSIRMKISQSLKSINNDVTLAAEVAGKALAFSTRSIETSIVVNSNDTAILGGLMRDTQGEQITKVPVLGDIPVLGWLFKGKSSNASKTNLLVFITPKIIRNSQDNSDLMDQKLNERITFIQRYMKGRDPHGEAIDNLPRRASNEEQVKPFINSGPSDAAPTDVGTEEVSPVDVNAPESTQQEGQTE